MRTHLHVSTVALVQGTERTLRNRMRVLPRILRYAAVGAILAALLDVSVGRRQEQTVVQGLDLVVLIDASSSMLAQDLEPDRIGAATRLAEELVTRRVHDRIALMTFAGEVTLASPLTEDRRALTDSIHKVSVVGRADGTALGAALAGAVQRLQSTPAQGRVVVVLTDGASNAGTPAPRVAAALAATYGVRVYAVGIGGTGSVPYPTEFGRIAVRLDFDERVLQQIASATGGRFVRAGTRESLEAVLDELDRLEPARYTVRSDVEPLALSPYLALGATAALLLAELLSLGVLRRLIAP